MSGGGQELKSFLAEIKSCFLFPESKWRERVSGEMGRIRADGNSASSEYD